MNNCSALEETLKESVGQPASRWFATLTRTAPADLPRSSGRMVGVNGRSRSLYLESEVGYTSPACAVQADLSVIFDGALVNHTELCAELSDGLMPVNNDAELALAGYLRWGQDFLARLRGTFALLIWDSAREILLCLRDPLGSHPLFYADAGGSLILSPSIEVLLQHPHVSGALNRPAMVDHFLDRYPKLEETFYEAVSRVPPGHVLRVTSDGRHVSRYWDPAPDGKVKWLTPDEVEQFDEVLDRAVSRCLKLGPTGIFLSGGLDSVSVAAVAVERSRAQGLPAPWALSLAFPDPESSEEVVQRGVAAQLGLRQVVKPFFEAIGPDGLLGPALAMSKSLPAPLMNTWLPAYYALAQEGSRRGCRGILTGGGGDEWLTVSPFLAADLLRDFDLVGFYRLYQTMRRSFRRSSLALLRTALWTFGVKPLVLPPLHKLIKQGAPWALKLRHQVSPRPAPWIPPKWLGPGEDLRRQFDLRRDEEQAGKQPTDSIYLREIRPALDHAVISWEWEEYFQVYQRCGVRMLQPFWDADIVEMLYRTPPFLLLQGGRNKSLVRASLARRFPDLGFEQHRKVEATTFYASLIYRNGKEIWQQLDGARTLADLGIVDETRLRPVLERLLTGRREGRNAHRVWTVLNLETWARAHAS